MTLILTNEEVDGLLTMDVCLQALEQGYKDLELSQAMTGPRMDHLAPTVVEGQEEVYYALKTMSGIAPRSGVAALRINSDLVYWPTREGTMRREKVPAAQGERWVGFIILFDSHTGEPIAMFPDGTTGRKRVGAANGLGAKYLARQDASVVGLLGSGWEAGGQIMAFCAVRPIKLVKVYSPNPNNRTRFAREMSASLGVEVRPVDSAEKAVEGVDIIAAATNSMDPIIRPQWLQPGVHASSIKVQEVTPDLFDLSDVVVFHYPKIVKQLNFAIHRPGFEIPETRSNWWTEPDAPYWRKVRGLGEMLTGKAQGRTAPRQVTFFLNNIGLGFQFACVGAEIYRRAREQGLGKEIPTEWFTQTVHS